MQNNYKAVILEDAVKDIRTAARVLSHVGITSPTVFNDVPKAMLYLEDVVAGEKPCPNLMVVDLGFGMDSGFEALRFYKSNEKLSRGCKVIVWTAMGERQRELCKLLGRATLSVRKMARRHCSRQSLTLPADTSNLRRLSNEGGRSKNYCTAARNPA